MALVRAPSQLDHIRDVWIVTVPIKDSTSVQQSVVPWLRRATSELDWSMHWVLCVGKHYLELQRTPRSAIPVLKVSAWSAEKVASIQRSQRIGISRLQDDQISEAASSFFTKYNRPYNWYVFNCQSFVLYTAHRICIISPIYQDLFAAFVPITAANITNGIMITLEPALRRSHRADSWPELALDDLMKRLRDRFEQRIYPDLFMGPVLNLDVEYAKGSNNTSLSHFVWDFFPAMYKFMLRNPVACEKDEGDWEIRTRSEEEIECEMQQIPAFVKPLTMATGVVLWLSCEIYVWGVASLIVVQRTAGILRKRNLGG